MHILERDVGLRPAAAALAAVFVVLPSPGTAAQWLEASGGIFETALYILLMWRTRRWPIWCGLIFGLGFVHRPFTAYGFLALTALDTAHGRLVTRRDLARVATMLIAAAGVWLIVQVVLPYSSAMGPGTTPADLGHRGTAVGAIVNRFCFKWQTRPSAIWKLATVHWPMLFGTKEQRLIDYAVNSHLSRASTASGGYWRARCSPPRSAFYESS